MALNLIMAVDIKAYLPQLVTYAGVVAVLMAFFMGFAKGFRKVSWTGITCALTFALFYTLNFLFGKANVKLNASVVEVLGKFKLTADSALAFILAIFSCIATLLLYGLCSGFFRPRKKWVNKTRVEIEDEELYGDGDGNAKKLIWINSKRPNFFGRLFGGVICAVNTAVILALTVSAFLFLINATSLVNTSWGNMLDIKIVKYALKYACRFTLDFLTLCIPFFMACLGYKHGLIGSIRSLMVSIGAVVALILSFYLPFSGLDIVEVRFIGKLVTRCTNLLGGVPETARGIAGKLLAGVMLFGFSSIVLVVINFVLAKSNKAIKGVAPMRVADGVVACVFYFIAGIIICVAVWCVLYVLEYCGLFKVSEVFGEDAVLANQLFNYAKILIQSIV